MSGVKHSVPEQNEEPGLNSQAGIRWLVLHGLVKEWKAKQRKSRGGVGWKTVSVGTVEPVLVCVAVQLKTSW